MPFAAALLDSDLALDQLLQARTNIERRNQQLLEILLTGIPGEVVKQTSRVPAYLFATGEKAEIRIETRCDWIIVAGAQMTISPDRIAFPANHEDYLGMNLEAEKTVYDVDAFAFQRLGPFDVAFFVEARL